MTPFDQASYSHADAGARAAVHVRQCRICPPELQDFLDLLDARSPRRIVCSIGESLLRELKAAEQDIAEAIVEMGQTRKELVH